MADALNNLYKLSAGTLKFRQCLWRGSLRLRFIPQDRQSLSQLGRRVTLQVSLGNVALGAVDRLIVLHDLETVFKDCDYVFHDLRIHSPVIDGLCKAVYKPPAMDDTKTIREAAAVLGRIGGRIGGRVSKRKLTAEDLARLAEARRAAAEARRLHEQSQQP